MKKSRCAEEQIAFALRQTEIGSPVARPTKRTMGPITNTTKLGTPMARLR